MPTSPLANNPGMFRVSGLWGEARDAGGRLLAEVTECSAAAEIQRIEVPIVGTNTQGYKLGRVSREGTFRVQKIDTKWELQVYNLVNAKIEDRRAMRGTSDSVVKPFTLYVGYDDPEALGVEKWQLDGCLLWRLPLGFSIGDDIRDLEFPFTYEAERPMAYYTRDDNGAINTATGLPSVTQVTPAVPTSG